ncbi:YcbK family protein [Campylobacter jejuni]
MKENKYFKESEFKCKCGKCELPTNVPSDELIDILCEIREHFDSPVTINSGYRCPEHNARVGGAKTSQHAVGSAADFVVKGVKTKDVYDYVISKYGYRPLGIAFKFNNQDEYAGFVHLDTRGRKARWEYK